MTARVSERTETVKSCTPRTDGAYWIITNQGSHAVSTEELPEGARVVIREGRAVRV